MLFSSADEFEPGKLRGGCNTTAVLQNDGQSYVAQLSGLQGLERNGSLTVDFFQNSTHIPNILVASCDKFIKSRMDPDEAGNACLGNSQCTGDNKQCSFGTCNQCNSDWDCSSDKQCSDSGLCVSCGQSCSFRRCSDKDDCHTGYPDNKCNGETNQCLDCECKECNSEWDCQGYEKCCAGSCKLSCTGFEACLSNTTLPLGVRELIVSHEMLQADGTLSDEGAR